MASKLQKPILAGHTAGIFADMTLDGPEIGTLVAVVDRAKNLPNRKTMGKQDPYCAMRLGKEAKKTDTDRRGGQTPKWDQELRFTVHDSPDYYKLKCSVFNDDKKTDLIGEAWLDLSDLVKPGGGSNDLWHQLNYKGKYAGDVRVELTYYDVRPRDTKPAEKKRSREGTPVAMSEDTRNTSSPRQLGPREVRRRPLPTSPAANSTVSAPSSSSPQQDKPPIPPPKIPCNEHDNEYQQNELQLYDDRRAYGHYQEEARNVQQSTQQYRAPFCEETSPMTEQEYEPNWDLSLVGPNDHHSPDARSSRGVVDQSTSNHAYHNETDMRAQAVSRTFQHSTTQPEEQYYSSTSFRDSPPRHVDAPYYAERSNTSPVKPIAYRDSPLRHSISQEEAYTEMMHEPESYDELPPPPPPMHRDTTPRKQQSNYPPSSFSQFDQSLVPLAPRPLNVTSRRRSIDDRNYHQQIEHDFDPRRSLQSVDGRPFEQHPTDFEPIDQLRKFQPSGQTPYDVYGSEEFSDVRVPKFHQETRHVLPQDLSHERSAFQRRSGSYDDHRLSLNPYVSSDRPEITHHSHSQPDLSRTEFYKPQPVRPQPTSSSSGHSLARKPVSPGLPPQQDSSCLSSTPFGPDAYDVLNPASSPVTNDGTIFQTRQQAKESARMREVEKLRGQGPIIGNDGRVIDPSDHLPSDTWAPEPERKQRRPEHVVHVRSKNDSRSGQHSNSAPATVRGHKPRPLPSVDFHVSQPTATSPMDNRHGLHKPAVTRLLPSQPYAQTHDAYGTDQRRMPDTITHQSNSNTVKRNSYIESSHIPQRPHLSEYQVMPANGQASRRSTYQAPYASVTSTPPMQTGREHHFRNSTGYDDPLAAEMSMIDIGPSRGRQMILSSRRAY